MLLHIGTSEAQCPYWVLEKWIVGLMGMGNWVFQYSIIPLFQHSNIPTFRK
jgi:hypothetical protein